MKRYWIILGSLSCIGLGITFRPEGVKAHRPSITDIAQRIEAHRTILGVWPVDLDSSKAPVVFQQDKFTIKPLGREGLYAITAPWASTWTVFTYTPPATEKETLRVTILDYLSKD